MKPFRRQASDSLGDKLNQQLKKDLDLQKRRQAMSEEELFSFARFDAAQAERTGTPDYSYWRSTLQAFFHNKTAVFFLCLMALTLLFTFIQPYLPGQKDPLFIHTNEWGLPLNNIPPRRGILVRHQLHRPGPVGPAVVGYPHLPPHRHRRYPGGGGGGHYGGSFVGLCPQAGFYPHRTL